MSGDSVDVDATDNVDLHLRLLAGPLGEPADHILSSPKNIRVARGTANVSGVRFSAVSSRNGGYFVLEVGTRAGDLLPIRSEKLIVLSDRLKTEGKANSIFELNANDNLVRVPGIGKKYAARLAECKFYTIRDLGTIAGGAAAHDERMKLLESIRRDRGALTAAKLSDLLRDAQTVVQRDDALRLSASAHAPTGDLESVESPVTPQPQPLDDGAPPLLNLNHVGDGVIVSPPAAPPAKRQRTNTAEMAAPTSPTLAPITSALPAIKHVTVQAMGQASQVPASKVKRVEDTPLGVTPIHSKQAVPVDEVDQMINSDTVGDQVLHGGSAFSDLSEFELSF